MATAGKLKLVVSNKPQEEPNKDALRPFKLWDPKEGKWFKGRWYLEQRSAYDAAAKMMNWAHTGDIIEIIDVHRMKEVGTYKRGVNSILIDREKLKDED